MTRWVLLALALMLPTAALADPKDDARRRFQQGVELARSGALAEAVELFKEANQIYQHPATTYNIAFAYQKLGQTEESLTWYRLLREQAPDRAAQVDAVIAELETELQARRVVIVPGPETHGSGGLAAEEIARLRDIAAELEELANKVGERPSVEQVGTDVPGDPVGNPKTADPAKPGDAP
ncbi:MAG: tetratricopeptide repeat protein, partial [Myxococcota bacterium]